MNPMNITIKNLAAKPIKVSFLDSLYLVRLSLLRSKLIINILDIPIPSDKDQLTIMDEMLETLVPLEI